MTNGVQCGSPLPVFAFGKSQPWLLTVTPKLCILRLLWAVSSQRCLSFCLSPPTPSLHWFQRWELGTVVELTNTAHLPHILWALWSVPENLHSVSSMARECCKLAQIRIPLRIYQTPALKLTLSHSAFAASCLTLSGSWPGKEDKPCLTSPSLLSRKSNCLF